MKRMIILFYWKTNHGLPMAHTVLSKNRGTRGDSKIVQTFVLFNEETMENRWLKRARQFAETNIYQ